MSQTHDKHTVNKKHSPPGLISRLAPGILVAATGVGAGDLLTASLGGSALGLVILWAAVVGALLKWVLNEGIARWQLATNTTLLEGWVQHLGTWIQWVFLIYLFMWTYLTGGALISACGVAGTGLYSFNLPPQQAKILWGILHSLTAVWIVRRGGFRVFEKLMLACISIMFITVLATASLSPIDYKAMLNGILTPRIPPGGMGWTLGLLGGVGGTLTLLSYGYWIREKGRQGHSGLQQSRMDLAVGYTMTALFGVAMVIIGSQVQISGRGATVSLQLAAQLEKMAGATGKWIFLIGFWGAVFSSLLGVWQSVPYIFADFMLLRKGRITTEQSVDLASTRYYRIYLYIIAIVPLPSLLFSVKSVQLAYAVFGALFMPLLALTLLLMNNKSSWVGHSFKNSWGINVILIITLLFFLYVWVDRLVGLF